MKKNILIGGAWPYANGSLHIGHIAALLPGDVLARYWRSKFQADSKSCNNVFYVSGSDCYGTPITIRAKQEGKTPEEISDFYHKEFCETFCKLGFSYDLYTKTTDPNHISFVRDFHSRLYQSSLIKECTVNQAYCLSCKKVLTDRLIVGKCPSCKKTTRGDQCDSCGEVLDVDLILDAKCAVCGSSLTFKETTQLYLLVSQLESQLRTLLEHHQNWRKNAISFTKRYIDEGLRDRAITRDLDWGIAVPKIGYEDKKIYIWAENVLGYLSASALLCEERGIEFKELFSENSRHYYVHGKDNIPFHTIILPSLLLAEGSQLHLPDDIISSEYVTLEGHKISTSQNWAVWVKDIVDSYHPDAIRYYFIANGPEKRDTDFSWREFAERNNADLVGIWGNFVNRTLAFIVKYLDREIPEGYLTSEIENQIRSGFDKVGYKIETGNFKDALDEVFELIRFGNKYYDSEQPWKTRKTDLVTCSNTLFNCVQLIANLSILLSPFLPFSSQKIQSWLNSSNSWKPVFVKSKHQLYDINLLFSRIDDAVVESEISKLRYNANNN